MQSQSTNYVLGPFKIEYQAFFVLVLLIANLVFSEMVLGQNFTTIDRVVETSIVSNNAIEARSQLNQMALEKASEEVIKEIIGEEKYSRNLPLVRDKIIKEAAKFIPFSKNGEMERMANGYKMVTQLKINLQDLKAMLLEHGLFYESDSTPLVLPLVRVIDRVNLKSLSWWMNQDLSERGFLLNILRGLESSLREAFIRNNFYVIKPLSGGYREFLDEKHSVEKLRPSAAADVSSALNAQLYIEGDFIISKSQERSEAFVLEVRMTATQAVNGRVIGEVFRKVETDNGAFEVVITRKLKQLLESIASDLSSQVLEAWQKGALGSSLYQLSLQGPVPVKFQELFKSMVRSRVLEVKNIRERRVERNLIVFEVDANITPAEIAKKLPEFTLDGVGVKLQSSSETGLIYQVLN